MHMSLNRLRVLAHRSKLKIGEMLGSGSFGDVRVASLQGTPVAVKKVHRHLVSEGSILDSFKEECAILEPILPLRSDGVRVRVGRAVKDPPRTRNRPVEGHGG